ncbi:MAG: leucine-rich repeat protein [Clostridia bacterium]|nr:leucine-rich repeat protein [Clostridia bacterium]
MTKKTTRRALITSIISMLLCVTMLVGTTFAWFTDSVKSGKNRIVAGNLDVELEYAIVENGKITKWETAEGADDILDPDALWEPGHTEVVYLRVTNKGTLALKYNLGVRVESETLAINMEGKLFKLSDYIKFGVVDGQEDVFASRDAARDEVANSATLISAGYSKSSSLEKQNDTEYVALVVYMPETVGNEANYRGETAPAIELGIELFATQLAYESDSFGPDYDETAPWTGAADTTWYNANDTEFTLSTPEQLAGLAELVNSGNTFAGKTVKLDADIDLNNVKWTPIGTKSAEGEKAFTRTFAGSFDGQGHTISNLRVVGDNALGFFGRTGTGTHIEDLNIDGAYVSGTDYVGAIAGYAYLSANCIKNCTVTDATIIATPFKLANGEYDGGAKAGVIVGYALNGNLVGNTVTNSSVFAFRDLGGIAGMLNDDGIGDRTLTASGNTVNNVTLNFVSVPGTYVEGKTNGNRAEIVGRLGAKASVGENTIDEVTLSETKAYVIYTADDLYTFASAVNGGKTFNNETVLLGADIDLANSVWTPIGNSTNKFQGTFDGNNKTIKNLNVNMPGKSDAGLFGMTTNGEIRNLTVENAKVTGRLDVGVVAGNPYTSKYTNITVTGHVEVNGMAYVGGVGGKNAYADWTNITVNVDKDSYVKAVSTENGIAYLTYVGGVVGFNGEGGHTFKNINSNINVIGDVCDIGGAFGIAHYNNKFENITVTGNVSAGTDAFQVGGIAGVWHNENGTSVSFIDCKFEGKITIAGTEVTDCDIVGGAYSATGTGVLVIKNYFTENGVVYYTDGVTEDIVLCDVTANAPAKLEIPEGVTVLGNKVLNGNTTVKEVVIPSSVKDFGGTVNATATGASGGMFYLSAVEKVVLPEGMKEIPVAAFNQATKLTSVNIPSSVEKIGINAFAGSGLTTLKISENVKEIGYGAFRDMTNLTTVTIEGDVYIPDYAFRACANLKDVYLNGLNVTFGTNMIFTVTSTNNEKPNGITVHVQNGEIEKRLLASGQFKGTVDVKMTATEGGYYKDAQGNALAYDANNLIAGLEADDNVVLMDDIKINSTSMSNSYGATGINILTGQTFDGNGNKFGVNAWNTWDSAISTTGGVIKNVTINSGMRGIFINHNSTESGKVYLENVIIDGTVYTISCDQGTNNGLEATNCTFNGWTSYAATTGDVKFVDCSFGEGQGYAYCRPYAPTEFVGCDFEAGFEIEPLAAVTFENCTIGGVALTAENLATLVISNIANASVK